MLLLVSVQMSAFQFLWALYAYGGAWDLDSAIITRGGSGSYGPTTDRDGDRNGDGGSRILYVRVGMTFFSRFRDDPRGGTHLYTRYWDEPLDGRRVVRVETEVKFVSVSVISTFNTHIISHHAFI